MRLLRKFTCACGATCRKRRANDKDQSQEKESSDQSGAGHSTRPEDAEKAKTAKAPLVVSLGCARLGGGHDVFG